MGKALVLYHSQEFGNTGKMAEAVAEGLRKGGCDVTLFNTNEGRFDASTFPQYEVVAFGSPDYYSYVAGGLKTFMDDHYILRTRKGVKGMTEKRFSLFYSHGGGGRVKDAMVGLFKYIGTQVGDPVGCQGEPTADVLEKCRDLGWKLAGKTKRG
jgi:flavorubredoxin